MIRYTSSLEGIAPEGLTGFFAGWPSPPTPETHLEILRGSSHVVLAVDSGRVVGFVTAISDGVQSAHIPLLEVLPDWQGQGIGGELTRRMLAALGEFYAIDLVCDPDLSPFYAKYGMREAGAMVVRNYSRQSGRAPSGGETETP